MSFFVLPIFTRLMNTHEYGLYSIYTSYLSIFEAVILLGLSATVSIARYAKEIEFRSYISTTITLPVALAAVCAVGINSYIAVFGSILSMDAVMWNCLLITATAGAVTNILGAKMIIDGEYRLYMFNTALYTVINITLSLLLCYTVFRTHDIHLARVYGAAVSSVVCMVFLMFMNRISFGMGRKNLYYALAWGIPLLFHTIATVVLTQTDRILILHMDSYSATGIYAVATTIVSIPMVLQSSFSQAWTPWFYDKLEKKEYENIRFLNNRYIILYGAIIAVFMLVSPEMIYLFTDKAYWTCIYSLVPLAISVFGEMLYSIPTSVEYYNKKTTYIMVGTLITVVINIVLDIIFIKVFGYLGAAYATSISKLILFLMHYIFSKRIDKNKVFGNGVAIITLLVLGITNVVVVLGTELYILRYAILTVIIAIVGWYTWKNRSILLYKLRT